MLTGRDLVRALHGAAVFTKGANRWRRKPSTLERARNFCGFKRSSIIS